jgi:hypothetical protein
MKSRSAESAEENVTNEQLKCSLSRLQRSQASSAYLTQGAALGYHLVRRWR